MLNKLVRVLAVCGIALLPACEDLSRNDRTLLGGMFAGAVLGYITADALRADDDWVIVAVLLGAAAGTLVARNSATNRCAYARGDGRYYVSSCPR